MSYLLRRDNRYKLEHRARCIDDSALILHSNSKNVDNIGISHFLVKRPDCSTRREPGQGFTLEVSDLKALFFQHCSDCRPELHKNISK